MLNCKIGRISFLIQANSYSRAAHESARLVVLNFKIVILLNLAPTHVVKRASGSIKFQNHYTFEFGANSCRKITAKWFFT